MHDISQKTDHLARMMLPGLLTLALFLVLQLPVNIAGLAVFPPQICLISLYYWSVFHPQTMPFWFAFLLGLLVDSLLMLPLGLSSFVFLLFRFAVLMQQRLMVRGGFLHAMVEFALMALGAQAVYWLAMTLFAGGMIPLAPLIMQWVMTVGLYPLAHILFSRVYKWLPPVTGKSVDWGL